MRFPSTSKYAEAVFLALARVARLAVVGVAQTRRYRGWARPASALSSVDRCVVLVVLAVVLFAIAIFAGRTFKREARCASDGPEQSRCRSIRCECAGGTVLANNVIRINASASATQT